MNSIIPSRASVACAENPAVSRISVSAGWLSTSRARTFPPLVVGMISGPTGLDALIALQRASRVSWGRGAIPIMVAPARPITSISVSAYKKVPSRRSDRVYDWIQPNTSCFQGRPGASCTSSRMAVS